MEKERKFVKKIGKRKKICQKKIEKERKFVKKIGKFLEVERKFDKLSVDEEVVLFRKLGKFWKDDFFFKNFLF